MQFGYAEIRIIGAIIKKLCCEKSILLNKYVDLIYIENKIIFYKKQLLQ